MLLAAILYAALAFLFYFGLFLVWLFGSLAREVRAARQPRLPPPRTAAPPPEPPGPVPQARYSNRR